MFKNSPETASAVRRQFSIAGFCRIAARKGAMLCGFFLALIAGTQPLIASELPPVRIMPLGASITLGVPVPGGYRAPLYQLLSTAGYNVDFVGTQSGNQVAHLPDSDHEGHLGFRIDHLDGCFQAWANRVADPDVIIVMVGANDFAHNNDLEHMPERLEHLIARIRTACPYSRIVIGELFVRTDYPDINERAQAIFNPALRDVVARHAARVEPVFLLKLNDTITGDDLSDGLHPNQAGYNKVASNIFQLVTNLVTRTGITNAPALMRAEGGMDLNSIRISFNKPIRAEDIRAEHFVVSDGLPISNATLDLTSHREVTLTTSEQTPNHVYTISAKNIRELSEQGREVDSGIKIECRAAASFGAVNNVSEATDYTLVYSLEVPGKSAFYQGAVPYSTDNHRLISGFSRVAYYLELREQNGPLQYVWVSMDAFTDDIEKAGVPAVTTGAFFQQPVRNMNVHSNVRGVVNGTGLDSGYLEFWPSAYSPQNMKQLPFASELLYDFSDQSRAGEYGSMQVHNLSAAQTIFAYNNWASRKGEVADLGIGNSYCGQPDWTRCANANRFEHKTLQVFVLPKQPSSSK